MKLAISLISLLKNDISHSVFEIETDHIYAAKLRQINLSVEDCHVKQFLLTSKTAMPTALPSAFPPKVLKWIASPITLAISVG